MQSNNARIVKVAPNGQISIGKKWAGREIRIEEISESEMKISAGSFVPDSQATFHTTAAGKTLNEFDSWAEQTPPKKTDLQALRAKFVKKASR